SLGPQKTPKPANPKVHRLWLGEHMTARLGSSSVHGPEKKCTLRTSVGRGRPVGTLARAVAQKVRTPPPPRRVQAPQRRETRSAAGVPTRPPWFYAAAGGGAVAVIAAIVLGVVLLHNNGGGTKSQANVASYNKLPGIRRT